MERKHESEVYTLDRSERWRLILEGLGSEATEEIVIREFGGLSYEEILGKLDQWFPAEDNEFLAELIYQVVP